MSIPIDTGVIAPDITRTAPHVLQVLPDLATNRLTRRVLALVRELSLRGGGASVASAGGRLAGQITRAGGTMIALPTGRGGAIASRVAPELLNAVTASDFEMIHLHDTALEPLARALALSADLPLIVTWNSLPQVKGFLTRRAARKRLLGQHLIVTSEAARVFVRDVLGLADERINIVRPGLDLADFSAETVSAERTIALADRWGIVEDARPVILIPSASEAPACLEPLLASLTQTEAMEATWVMLASPDTALPSALDGPAFATRLRWITDCDDLAAACKLASVVLCLPCANDRHIDSALEAQAMGRPVILLDVGAAREVLIAGQTGWLVPPGDSTALAATLGLAMALDDSGRDHLGLAARSFVQSHFSLARMQDATLAVYEQVRAIERTRKP